MTQHLDFTPASDPAGEALGRCARVVDDFVGQLGNLGALVAIDIAGLGRVTFTAGHSDLARSRAVQPGDLFQIGSQTKTISTRITRR